MKTQAQTTSGFRSVVLLKNMEIFNLYKYTSSWILLQCCMVTLYTDNCQGQISTPPSHGLGSFIEQMIKAEVLEQMKNIDTGLIKQELLSYLQREIRNLKTEFLGELQKDRGSM